MLILWFYIYNKQARTELLWVLTKREGGGGARGGGGLMLMLHELLLIPDGRATYIMYLDLIDL